MRKDPELESILNEKGGLYQSDDELELFWGPLRSRFRKHCEFAQQSLYAKSNRQVEFDFISNTDINAFAYASPSGDGEFDFIGINCGSGFFIHTIINRIFAHPDAFPNWGDAQKERIDYALLRTLGHDDLIGPIITPKCPIRQALASALFATCMDFLFFHELAHLRNGHLEWLRSTKKTNHFIENNSEEFDISYSLKRQALEMDADSGAMVLTFQHAMFIHSSVVSEVAEQNARPPSVRNALNLLYGTPERCAQTTALASYIFFRIFDKSGWNIFKPDLFMHPEIPLRMHWSATLLWELFNTEKYVKLGLGNINFLTRVAPVVEQAYGLIQGITPDPRGIQSALGDALNLNIAHLVEVKKAWTLLHPILEINVRGGKLAPP